MSDAKNPYGIKDPKILAKWKAEMDKIPGDFYWGYKFFAIIAAGLFLALIAGAIF